jgi:Protein of unknown function (DUF3224)
MAPQEPSCEHARSMSTHASGTFEAKFDPQPPYDAAEGATLGRVSITKQFSGDLEGASTVEMLNALTEVKGSAGYVALERVTGTLHGRAGTFVLQHSGIMNRGAGELRVTVVPDSGTGALRHLAGSMKIDIVEGKHHWRFDYTVTPPG